MLKNTELTPKKVTKGATEKKKRQIEISNQINNYITYKWTKRLGQKVENPKLITR